MTAAAASFIGSAFSERRVGDFVFGWWWTSEFGPAVKEHDHDRAHVMFACAGEYRTRVSAARRMTHAIIFNPAGTAHDDRFESPGLFFSLTFDRPAEELFGDEAPSRPVANENIGAPLLLNRISATRGDDPQAKEHAEALVAELMAGFARTAVVSGAPKWLRCTEEALRDSPAAPSVSRLARDVGIHPYHFAAMFRRAHGCTPAQYARNLRLRRSLHTLASTNMPIAEVAAHHGFADQSHFTRAVSSMFGIGPAELRRRLR